MHAYCSQKLVVLTDGSWSAVDELLIAGSRRKQEASEQVQFQIDYKPNCIWVSS